MSLRADRGFVAVLSFVLLAVLLSACQPSADDSPAPSGGSETAGVDIERFRNDLVALSSDAFGGREPSTDGEKKTVEYLIQAFKEAGLVGGNNGSFTQDVPLVAITAESVVPLKVTGDAGEVEFMMGREAVAWTKRVVEEVTVQDSEVVFVGYGVVAPEYGWNDYEGLDVAGKTVVMLVNDPGFASGDETLFNGRSMTYYGRWTYKFEEAARQGATGAIIVHATEAAGYPWLVVQGGWNGAQYDLQRPDGNASRAAFEGWISSAAAERLFAEFGHDFGALSAAALSREFEPVALGGSASIAITNTLERSQSKNVVALLPGTTAPDETVGFSAHWDHLGTVENGEEDGIFNGAVDNASGTAGLLEMARVLAEQEHRRSLLFIAVTAEESGLLGSDWFADQPTVPLAKMAGLINIDAMNTIGPTRDVVVVGHGSSELEGLLERAASTQGRVLVPETTPEKGFFYRSDHFNFAKRGVPVLYAESGIDHVDGGPEYGAAKAAEYVSSRYHSPADEITDDWEWAGMALDLELYLAVARELANTEEWPNWYAGNEFRQLRDRTAVERQR